MTEWYSGNIKWLMERVLAMRTGVTQPGLKDMIERDRREEETHRLINDQTRGPFRPEQGKK